MAHERPVHILVRAAAAQIDQPRLGCQHGLVNQCANRQIGEPLRERVVTEVVVAFCCEQCGIGRHNRIHYQLLNLAGGS